MHLCLLNSVFLSGCLELGTKGRRITEKQSCCSSFWAAVAGSCWSKPLQKPFLLLSLPPLFPPLFLPLGLPTFLSLLLLFSDLCLFPALFPPFSLLLPPLSFNFISLLSHRLTGEKEINELEGGNSFLFINPSPDLFPAEEQHSRRGPTPRAVESGR